MLEPSKAFTTKSFNHLTTRITLLSHFISFHFISSSLFSFRFFSPARSLARTVLYKCWQAIPSKLRPAPSLAALPPPSPGLLRCRLSIFDFQAEGSSGRKVRGGPRALLPQVALHVAAGAQVLGAVLEGVPHLLAPPTLHFGAVLDGVPHRLAVRALVGRQRGAARKLVPLLLAEGTGLAGLPRHTSNLVGGHTAGQRVRGGSEGRVGGRGVSGARPSRRVRSEFLGGSGKGRPLPAPG